MNHYLLIYNRRTGKLVRSEEFSDRNEALDERFEAERQLSGDRDIEVVVLGADSWDALQRTHARYFKTVQELAAGALRHVQSTVA